MCSSDLDGILHICRGERLIDGANEVPQGRRVKFDELKSNRRVIAVREISNLFQQCLWRFREHSLLHFRTYAEAEAEMRQAVEERRPDLIAGKTRRDVRSEHRRHRARQHERIDQ